MRIAIVTPKTVLMATEISAIRTVRISAWRMSGSSRMARMSVKPSAKAFLATSTTGHATSSTR